MAPKSAATPGGVRKSTRQSARKLPADAQPAAHPVTVLDPSTSDVDAETFWKQHIQPRLPAHLLALPRDLQALPSALSREHLASVAGDVKVKVEQRSTDQQGFGKGKTVMMALKDFATAIQQGDTSLYLSTQEATLLDDGVPAVLTPPLSKVSELPLRPELAGNLVPHAINLWVGSSAEGTSSGLHHDYHDNMYVLLRGTKRFRLWPPSSAPNMYTYGTIATAAPNGLISYKEQAATNDDGSDPREVALWQCQQEMKEQLALALTGNKAAAARAHAAAAKYDELVDKKMEADLDEFVETGKKVDSEGEPLSFSRVDLSQPQSATAAAYPGFPGIDAAVEVTVNAGQMLYLPAGWFHEVTSYGSGGLAGAPEGPPGLHMALNYWFYPPTNLKDADGEQPYTSGYWPAIWDQRCRQEQQQDEEMEGGEDSESEEASDDEQADYVPSAAEQRALQGMGRTTARDDALFNMAKEVGISHRRHWNIMMQDYWSMVQASVRQMFAARG